MSRKIIVIITAIVILGGLIVTASRTRKENVSNEQISSTMPTIENNTYEKKSVSSKNRQYTAYTPVLFNEASGKIRILYFHADWCPTCRLSDKEFIDRPDAIPKDVIIFKVNYDTEESLKKQYSITYQHTFVLVDPQGEEQKKWSGGGISELITNIN